MGDAESQQYTPEVPSIVDAGKRNSVGLGYAQKVAQRAPALIDPILEQTLRWHRAANLADVGIERGDR
jgi:hypothetical protein